MKNIISSHISSRVKNLSIKLKAFILPIVALIALALVLNTNHAPSRAELRFAETSPAGETAGAVIPASCESGYAHFAGECTTAVVAPVVPPPPTACTGWGCQTYCGLTNIYWGAACHGVTGNYDWGVWHIVYNDTPGYSGAHTASCNGYAQIQKDTPADFPGYSDPQLIYPYCNAIRYDPIGWLDSVDASHVARGWTLDQDTPAASVTVHFYVDGPAGSGTMIGMTSATTSRPDVHTAFGLGANHGFVWEIPNGYCTGANRTLYAYAIDTAGLTAPLLSGSPKTFNCVAAGPTVTVTRSPWSNIAAGTTGGLLSWATTNATNLALNCTGPFTTNVPSVSPLSGSINNNTYSASLAGTSTCVWTATGPGGVATYSETFTVASGDITMSSSTCTIATGQSTCTVNAGWTTVNAVSPNLKDNNTGLILATSSSGSNLQVYVTGGVGTTFKLYSNTALLDTEVVTGVCESGSAWGGSSCLAATVQINSGSVDDSNNLNINHTCTNSTSYEIWITKPTPSILVASGTIPGANFSSDTRSTVYSLNAILAASSTLQKIDVTVKCQNGPTAEASLIAPNLTIPSRTPPTVDRFSVVPAEVVCGGGKVTLSWDIRNGANKNCKLTATSSRDISNLSPSDKAARISEIADINAYLNTNGYSSKTGAGNGVSTSTAFNAEDAQGHSKADISNIDIKHSTKFILTCNPNISTSRTANVACVSEN